MKLLYIAGPYTMAPGPANNTIAARPIAVEAWRRGWAVICPHLNSYGMERTDVPPQAFYDGYLAIVAKCDAVLLIPGWERSVGALAEAAEAERLGIPVVEYERDGVPAPGEVC